MSQCWGGEWGTESRVRAGRSVCSEDMGTVAGRNPEGSGFPGWDEAAMAQGVCPWPASLAPCKGGGGGGEGGMPPACADRSEGSSLWLPLSGHSLPKA